MTVRRKLQKYIGPVAWVPDDSPYRGSITRAIIRGQKELVIELEEDGWVYSLHLVREFGESFRGHWTCQEGSIEHTGTVSAKLFTSDESNLLFGDWIQDGVRSHWWAELTKVEHFADETSD